jgi:DNA (cytosine-5)-methyltransferase 1
MSRRPAFSFLEFFAGGGMARVGLGDDWACLFANDVDPKKASVYRANFGGEHLALGDVWALDAADLPAGADLAWASSPCQDLSLAGARAGLGGARSSAFWGFWRQITALDAAGGAPHLIVLENVAGLLSSNGGGDLAAIGQAFAARGYRFGALEIDAAAFLPQSRPRAFVVAARGPVDGLAGDQPGEFASPSVVRAVERLPESLKRQWAWWRLPPAPRRNTTLASVLEPDGAVAWRSDAETAVLLGQMSARHLARLAGAAGRQERVVAAVYRRVRIEQGARVQRAELRLDGLAGCLRTPGGGSSRQLLVFAEGGVTRSRWMTPREGARLMGLPESYQLPAGHTAAWRVIGDGVAAPVVRHLAGHLLEPLIGRGIASAEPHATISERTRRRASA